MATLIYLPSSGAPDVTPSTWIFANQINPVTFKAATAKAGSTMTTKTEPTDTTSPITKAMVRWVIGPLAAQSISGTVRMVIRARESNAGANAQLAMAVKIIQPDGTDRATLLGVTSADSASSPYELTTTLSTRRVWLANETEPPALTTQSATAGDYLVVELGFRSATTTSRNIDLRLGDVAASDLTYGDAETNDFNGWVEFSANLSFQTPPVEESITLTMDEAVIHGSDINAQSAITLEIDQAALAGSDVSLQEAASLTQALNVNVAGGLAVDEAITLGTNLGLALLETMTLYDSMILGLQQSLSPEASVQIGEALTLSQSLAITASAPASAVEESISLEQMLGTTLEATLQVDAAVTLTALQAALTESQIDAQSEITLPASLSAIVAANVVLQAQATLIQNMAIAAGTDPLVVEAMLTLGANLAAAVDAIANAQSALALQQALGIIVSSGEGAVIDESIVLTLGMATSMQAHSEIQAAVQLWLTSQITPDAQAVINAQLSFEQSLTLIMASAGVIIVSAESVFDVPPETTIFSVAAESSVFDIQIERLGEWTVLDNLGTFQVEIEDDVF